MNAEIHYLFNSGFTVKTERHFFIFDYYLDSPHGCGLSKGVVDPEEIKDLNVVVFVSHRHPDHYNPRIFSWRKEIPNIRYILSDDIRTQEDVLQVRPGQNYDLGDLQVRVLESTDTGAAFVLYADGLRIYHAGDLNLWDWIGEPEEDNAEMTRRYHAEIDRLAGEAIDLAFVPVDPRLEGNYLLGLDYFMKKVGAKLVIPMHFTENPAVMEWLKTDPAAAEYREKIAFFSGRGAEIRYTK